MAGRLSEKRTKGEISWGGQRIGRESSKQRCYKQGLRKTERKLRLALARLDFVESKRARGRAAVDIDTSPVEETGEGGGRAAAPARQTGNAGTVASIHLFPSKHPGPSI